MKLHIFVGFWLHHFIQLAASQLTADIFLTQLSSTPNPNPEPQQPISSLTTAEFNALLSHRFNISQFETLPKSLYPTTATAQLLFGDPHSDLPLFDSSSHDKAILTNHHPKILLVLYGINHKVLPAQTISHLQWLSLPNPPDILSFDALFSIFIGRIVDTIKVPISSIFGVKDFIKAYHAGLGVGLLDNIREWASDWNESLQDWIEWAHALESKTPEALQVNHHLEANPDQNFLTLLKDYGHLDHAAYQLIEDTSKLEEFKSMMTATDEKRLSKISFIRLSSLQQIQIRHGENSHQYRIGVSIMKSMLSDLLLEPSVKNIEKIIITVPAQPGQARLGKRTSLSILSPFKTSETSFVQRELLDRRRAIFGTTAASTAIPIIPSSRKCFNTKTQCEKDTQTCNEHGTCVEGQKTSGGKCFVCVCQASKDFKNGKTTYWSGDSCQKEDLSSGFVLLAGSAIGLIILFGLAIRLLMSIGSDGLPQQLASVTSSSKKND